VRDAERDLKKLKKESTGYFKGGWGTFIIAFEDEEAVRNLIEKKLTEGHPSNLGHISAPSPTPKTRKVSSKISMNATPEKEKQVGKLGARGNNSNRDMATQGTVGSTSSTHPIEKISHFVEVGFLIDSNNFRLLSTYDETTYDS